MLYCSLFLPYINYCSEIWGNTYATNVECITVLQKRVVCVVCGARCLDHTNHLFKQLGIFTFVDLRHRLLCLKRITMNYRIACKKCLICMYKYMIFDKNIHSVFIVGTHTNVNWPCVAFLFMYHTTDLALYGNLWRQNDRKIRVRSIIQRPNWFWPWLS